VGETFFGCLWRRAGVVGLLSLLYDKRAGTAAITYNPDGLLMMVDLEIFGHKKACSRRLIFI